MSVDVNFIRMFKQFHLISHTDLVVTSKFEQSGNMLFFYVFMKVHGTLVGGSVISKQEQIKFYDDFSYNGDTWNESPSKTKRKHAYARIANYLEQPFIVGGSDSGNTITERLSSLGIWEQDNKWPFSNRIFNYATVSRKLNDKYSDYVLIIGGQTGDGSEQSDQIAKFADGLSKWTIVGHLQQPRHSHSAIQNSNNQILVVGGDDLR